MKKKRLAMVLFYKKSGEENPDYCYGVIFTDEMSIEVRIRRGQQMVTRLSFEEWDNDCIIIYHVI